MKDHLIFREGRISVPCDKCGTWPSTPHVIGIAFYCAGCCPVCKPVEMVPPAERTGPVVELGGEQGGLF